jgi:glyoxylase-like metal-dependent hydrolase (beta-lactamase superfamily II)
VTHGHGDHWLGVSALVDRLPNAKVVATPGTVKVVRKRPGTDDDPRIIEHTRQYIRDFDKLAESTKTSRELYDQMLNVYPDLQQFQTA